MSESFGLACLIFVAACIALMEGHTVTALALVALAIWVAS